MKHFKIKHKLFIFIFIGAFLTSFLGVLFVQLSQSLYNEIIYRETSDKFYLFSKRIEEQLKGIDQLSLSIMSDPEVQQALITIKSKINTYEAYTAATILKQKLGSYHSFDTAISSIEIIDWFDVSYSVGQNATMTTSSERRKIQELAAVRDGASFWIGGLIQPDLFYSIRQIKETSILRLQPLGTLIIHTRPDKTVYSSANERFHYDSSLLIQAGEKFIYPPNVKYQPSDFQTEKGKDYSFSMIDGKRYLVAHFTLDYTGWTFIHLVPYGSIFEHVRLMKMTLIGLYAVIVLLVLWFGLKISRGITRPLERLTTKMSAVEKGQLVIDRLEISERDEIGKLSRNFDRMVERLNKLIQEDYMKQIMLKEAEYETLKAKLNPHFLYNTLESINWLAKMKGQPQISDMVKALGDLLRDAVSEKEVVTIREELDNLHNYILIQKFRFEERLDFHVHIDDKLKELYMPNFILQPIVENAIKYGVESVQEICQIVVSAVSSNQRLYISVKDTGLGMDENYLDKLRAKEIEAKGTGIGLFSIDERLQLLYGESYGVRIRSEWGKGTTVIFTIPLMKNPIIREETKGGNP
ncbi:sensor histidine kinase [Cohnella sp. WQ 127256]|uniref:sensor histidine kinase n=1 Tax=Cohnella sp. WQ 127256 TaxID=2938790 RepID=UPI00211823B9|nr:sensor histidine kinase [Cohnella sp. WQ 127256]